MFFFIIRTLCIITELRFEDLNSEETFLIYVYYERPNYKCPTCALYESELKMVKNIDIKKINFYKNTVLASRLCNVFFPSIIIFDHKRLHSIDLMSADEINDLVDKKLYNHNSCKKFHNNPNNFVIILHSYCIYFFYDILRSFYSFVDRIPNFVISILIGFLLSVSLYIFIVTVKEVFYDSKVEKEKDD